MKTFNFTKLVQVLLLSLMVLFLLSCEKDETVEYEPTPEVTENRTGQPVTVFFDLNGVFSSSNLSDSIQTVVNLRNVDSIRYVGDWQNPFVTVNGVLCFEYDITFYEVGNVVYERKCYAKWRGITYKQIIGQLEGWDSDIRFFHSVRLSYDLKYYFDHECLKVKSEFKYLIRERMIDNSSVVEYRYLRSNMCNRNDVRYPRTFKP